jgi:hypothetical protein
VAAGPKKSKQTTVVDVEEKIITSFKSFVNHTIPCSFHNTTLFVLG